mgnify:CR=1 FL=1
MSEQNVRIDGAEIARQNEIMELVKKSGGERFALVETYGCQQNVNDSQRLTGMLEQMGYKMTDEREKADVIIFNTCAVRENAEDRVFGNLGALKHLKERRPGMIIAVCGCMVQQEQIAARIKARYRHVDLIFGTHALWRFPELLMQALQHSERILDIGGSGSIAEGLPVKHDGGSRAFVSVMYGCNNFCSYCIVPYVRGRERSRAAEDILCEVKSLAESGVREVMLLGQNVNSYGLDRGEKDAFAKLLESVCTVDGIERIRFMSSHPKDISERLLQTMAQQEKICNQLHLPLQSGSDKVLADMNRHYTAARYMKTVEKARELMPDIALTTDIIVGFPTETEEDFKKTEEILSAARFDSIFSFIYSKRTGTRAAKLEPCATEEEISARFRRMLDLQNKISLEQNKRHEGKTELVLVEGPSKNDPDMMTGRNYANKIVNFKGTPDLAGQIIPVKITRAQTWILCGELER